MGNAISILAVDDEPDILDIIEQYLSSHQYDVDTASSVSEAREKMSDKKFDLLVLDLNLPGESGLSFAQSMDSPDRPAILMLTGLGAVNDRLSGFAAGADDYLVKPFEPRELLARVKSLSRRVPERGETAQSGDATSEPTVPFGDCQLDLKAHVLYNPHGEEVALTSMEFDLLRTFAERPNRILNRDQLMELSHHREWSPDDRSIDIRIARLRKKVEKDPKNPEVLLTVRGLGYKFVVN